MSPTPHETIAKARLDLERLVLAGVRAFEEATGGVSVASINVAHERYLGPSGYAARRAVFVEAEVVP